MSSNNVLILDMMGKLCFDFRNKRNNHVLIL
jgi:hypothetical protein